MDWEPRALLRRIFITLNFPLMFYLSFSYVIHFIWKKINKLDIYILIEWLIDCREFYAISAVIQQYNGHC